MHVHKAIGQLMACMISINGLGNDSALDIAISQMWVILVCIVGC